MFFEARRALTRQLFTQNPPDYLVQTLHAFGCQPPHGFDDPALLDGGNQRLEYLGFDQPCCLPVLQQVFAGGQRLADLTGNRHQDHMGPVLLIALAADDHGGAFLGNRQTNPALPSQSLKA